jgi:uncharacterized protein DUF2846
MSSSIDKRGSLIGSVSLNNKPPLISLEQTTRTRKTIMKQFKYLMLCICVKLVILGLVVISSCTPSNFGPRFDKIDNIPPNAGLVYLYRSERFRGAKVWFYVTANGEVMGPLYNDGYYPYFSKPGKTVFNAESYYDGKMILDHTVSIEVQAGHTYYIRATTLPQILELVTPDIGEKEIKDCKIIQTVILPTLP